MTDTETMTDAHATGDREPGLAAPVLAGRMVPMLDRARIYVCGITPYDVTHLGHAATYVWVDVLGRVLHLLGVEPEVCRNVTDVDDVLDAAASRARRPYDAFAAIQQYHFEHDLAALNVRPPRHEPRAHRYIQHVIRLASGLMAAGTAYKRNGSVYFRSQAAVAQAGLNRAGALRLSAEYGGVPMIPRRTIRWIPRSGRRRRPGILPGTRRGEQAGRDGMRNASPWRYQRLASALTSTPAEMTSASLTTPTTRPWPRRSPGSRPTHARGCTLGR